MPINTNVQKMREQAPLKRIKNFDEVNLGYTKEQAVLEASRCIQCKKPKCIEGCPVAIDIPGFIKCIAEGNFEEAIRIIKRDNTLPGICGRVCPQEEQCEQVCVLNTKKAAIKIGYLERFAADYEKPFEAEKPEPKNKKVAIVGGGPAGLTCAAELIMMGYEVVLFEALHKAGGVLVYGIPEFRMPNKIIEKEVEYIKSLGVTIKLNMLVGKTITIDELEKEFDAIFIGTGAGLPYFMGLPGENLIGVLSANEFLTRSNLMVAYRFPEYDTPIKRAKKSVIIGGGNVAMDSARTAKRLGAEATILYRRTRNEMPARIEEIGHAEEEEIIFHYLASPLRILGETVVEGIESIRMELGEPDDSGRRRPIPIEGSEFTMECDQVIIAIGQGPNPLLVRSCNLEHGRKNNLIVDEKMQTSNPKIFAGGDITSGAATVIKAMEDAKKAAKSIDEFLNGPA